MSGGTSSGFLARIAARAEGRSVPGQLRPRPVSRFEPVARGGEEAGAWAESPAEEAAGAGLPSHRARPDGQRPSAGLPLLAAEVVPGTAVGAEAVADLAEDTAVGTRPEPLGEPPRRAFAAPPAAGPDLTEPPALPVTPDRHPAAARPTAARPGTRSPEPPHRHTHVPAEAARRSPAPAPAPTPAPPADPAWRSEQRTPPADPRPSAHRRPSPTSAPTAPAPVVHITIGRVEVRAVPAEPPRAERGRAGEPAVTTLDQYLRRRARGRG